MSNFKGVSERFRVTVVYSEGNTERVTVQLGLDGLKLLNQEGTHTMRSYELSHISRWHSTSGNLVLYTKTPVDVEERQLTLTADSNTIRNVLDTLTSCCMQLAEILQSGRSTADLEAGNSLHQLVTGGGKKKTPAALPSADSVEYWHDPEKSGWLQSQAEVTKLWRKRWFVLKQGYLFRFLSNDVSENTKPRGVVDLSKVQDVRDGRSNTGRPNSIQLKTSAGGSVCYICESETEMVEWMSALEGGIAKIVKLLAGVEEESKPSAATPNKTSTATDWAQQMRHTMDRSASSKGPAMVNVVGYDGPPASSSAYGGYGGSGGAGGYGGSGGAGAGQGITSYSQISGVAGVAGGGDSGGMDDTMLNYGGYPNSHANTGGGGGNYGNTGGGSAYPSTSAGGNYGGGGVSTPYSYPPSGGSYDQDANAGYGANGYGASSGVSSLYQQGSGGYAGGSSAGYWQQQPHQQQQSSAPSLSLIDQVPSQQPAYPYYPPSSATQHASSAAAPPPPVPQQNGTWQTLYTPEGRAYYYNRMTGTTQWDAPPGV